MTDHGRTPLASGRGPLDPVPGTGVCLLTRGPDAPCGARRASHARVGRLTHVRLGW